jgi:hypothetical protein
LSEHDAAGIRIPGRAPVLGFRKPVIGDVDTLGENLWAPPSDVKNNPAHQPARVVRQRYDPERLEVVRAITDRLFGRFFASGPERLREVIAGLGLRLRAGPSRMLGDRTTARYFGSS